MAEVTADAMILISISWQALHRALKRSRETLLCDCIVVIFFAGVFIEAYLNYIIDQLKKTEEDEQFFKRKPGLEKKLGWVYMQYVEPDMPRDKFYLDRRLKKKLKKKFPGYDQIHDFRNHIAHGELPQRFLKFEDEIKLLEAEKLRDQAKAIVTELIFIAEEAGFVIPRYIRYIDAITSNAIKTDINTNPFESPTISTHSSS